MTAALAGMMLPTMMLSGFIFPVESMPPPAVDQQHHPGEVVPDHRPGIMLKGSGLAQFLWQETLLAGETALVVTIPQGFEDSLWRDGRSPVQLVVDGERGSAAGIIQSFATRIVARYGAELSADRAPGAATAGRAGPPPHRGVPRVEVRMRGWYNPALDYKHYMVPGSSSRW
jgi:hypothetical protein